MNTEPYPTQKHIKFPELRTLWLAVERGIITPDDENPSTRWLEPTVRVDQLITLWKQEQARSSAPIIPADYRKRFSEASLMRESEAAMNQIPATLKEAFPEINWDRVATRPRPELDFENIWDYSHYIDLSRLNPENKRIELHIGGDAIRNFVVKLLVAAASNDIAISDDDVKRLATACQVAHEYGHHIQNAYEDEVDSGKANPTYAAAIKLNGLGSFELHQHIGEFVFSEHVAQSLAANAVATQFDSQLAQLAKRTFFDEQLDVLQEFMPFFNETATGISLDDWGLINSSASTALAQADIFDFFTPLFRMAGYYLGTFTKTELQNIFALAR